MTRFLICAIIISGIAVTGFLFAEESLKEESFKYDSGGNRDPFVPLISEAGSYASDAYGISSIRDIRLEGIVWDETSGSIAIINGEIVKEGQEIGTAEVVKIEKAAVIFNIDNQEIKIELADD